MSSRTLAKSLSRVECKGLELYGLILCLVLALSIWTNFNTLLRHPSFSGVSDEAFKALTHTVIGRRMETICNKLIGDADLCEIEGDIRIEGNTATIFVMIDEETITNSTNLWTIKPYPRGYTSNVRPWTIKLVRYNDRHDNILKCTHNHNDPAILFSTGGYIGSHLYSITDLLLPLYMTSIGFQRRVYFLATDYRAWWISKFTLVLDKLSRHRIINIDIETEKVHCYRKVVVGLYSTRGNGTWKSVQNFKQFVRDAYSLKRKRSMVARPLSWTMPSPRLMIVSRKGRQVLVNKDEIVGVARKLGFKVVLADAGISTEVSRVAQLVNSCDAMMGLHGAELTNMLFLPDNAVLIQLLPSGDIDHFFRLDFEEPAKGMNIKYLDFEEPAKGMNIKYLEYNISREESPSREHYLMDISILKDAKSIHTRKVLEIMSSTYLQYQNFSVDVKRFKFTLVKALELLLR